MLSRPCWGLLQWKSTHIFANSLACSNMMRSLLQLFSFLKGRRRRSDLPHSNLHLIRTAAFLSVSLLLKKSLFLLLLDTHPWQCLSCRCVARHGRACRNRSVLRSPPTSLSVPPGTEPRYLGNTKHTVLRETGAWQAASMKKLPELH